jgi:membrane-bound metal-dependent hydrolase YbcI (DUF457 family)
MVMGPTHRAIAAPFGIALAMGMGALGEPLPLCLAAGVVVVASAKIPDGDHPRLKGKVSHPAAALIRGVARVGYAIRTENDEHHHDLHRGPSHCAEFALLTGLVIAGLLSLVPFLTGPPAWWLGAAVALGCLTHILGDVITPSGVPVCATYSWLRHGEVWRRYSFGLLRTDSGAEHFVLVPFTWLISATVVAAWLGVLGPVVALATGWSP